MSRWRKTATVTEHHKKSRLGRDAPVPIQNFEKCKEAIDICAVRTAFNAPNSGTEAPALAEVKNDRGASARKSANDARRKQ
jgi:hypothetical protein